MESVKIDVDKLEVMKRVELQKLCKSVGIKANSKTTQLIEVLKEYVRTLDEKPDSQESSDKEDKDMDFVGMEQPAENAATEVTTAEMSHIESDDNYKKELMEQLDKKVYEKMPMDCKIPRFVQFIAKTKAESECNKGSTKWDSIHKSQFDKMDSIDVYLEKKRKRMESLNQSVKRAKTAIDASKSCGKRSRSSIATKKTPARESLGLVRKSHDNTARKAFNPATPTSISKSTTFSFVFGSPMAKPVFNLVKKKSTGAVLSLSTSQKKPRDDPRTPGNQLSRKSIATTPFSFLPANVPKATSPTPRKKFDLKASLAKPLNYKPHAGKLKPLSEYKEQFKPTVTESKLKSHRADVKSTKVTSREERRLKNVKNRESRRVAAVSRRRGLVR